jgi:hypothetical protein
VGTSVRSDEKPDACWGTSPTVLGLVKSMAATAFMAPVAVGDATSTRRGAPGKRAISRRVRHIVELEADGQNDLRALLSGGVQMLTLRRRVGALVDLGGCAEVSATFSVPASPSFRKLLTPM